MVKAKNADRVGVHVRWMIRRDLPDVMAIQAESFDDKWSEGDFIVRLRQRNCIGMVVEVDEVLVGYMLYEMYKQRIELVALAVDKGYRRMGIGSAMVEKLKSKLSRDRRWRLGVIVDEWNTEAHLFFKSCGLRAIEVLNGIYIDPQLDAYRFVSDYGG